MAQNFFSFLTIFEDILWVYIGVPIIVIFGVYLTYKSRVVQVRYFPQVIKNFIGYMRAHEHEHGGVHPIKTFFASVGGCIGIANVVAVCTAVQIGGPGALFWIWVTAFLGMILKYAEVYLGLRYRVINQEGDFLGGPMYYLKRVFKGPIVPSIFCVLLAFYGVEFYQFSVVTHSIVQNFEINQYVAIGGLLLLVIFAGSGGVRRVGAIATAVIPLFLIFYIGMSMWLIAKYLHVLPEVIKQVFTSAFTGHAALGGFVGSTFMVAASQGVRRGCYSGDVGIGYAAVIYSESMSKIPEKQASLVFLDIFLDTIVVCTLSIFIILVTGIWTEPIPADILVQRALEQHFPYMNFFMPLFLFLLGYSTINAYFVVGLRCAEYLSPNWGKTIFYVYAVIAMIIFSFFDSLIAQSVMTVAGGLLLIINCYGIYRLRHDIRYPVKH